MSFWQAVHQAAGMGNSLGWLIVVFLLVSAVLFLLFPEERMRIRTALTVFLVSALGLAISAAILNSGQSSTSIAFRLVRWLSALLLGVALVNVASVVIFDVFLSAIRLRIPRILRDLLLAASYIVIAISLLSKNGVDLTGIIATSTVVTAIIGLSFQDTLGNIMGGLALQMERTIHAGDWVKVEQIEGRVKEIRWRFTSIETRNWDTIVIPNGMLMKAQVVLLGRREDQPVQRREWVYFNVDFRFLPSDVIQIVETALCAVPIPNVATQPAAHCILVDFAESYCRYAVRYWLTDLAVDAPTNSVVRERIFFALKRANIMPSIPAQAVFVTADDLDRRARKHAEETERRISVLKRLELFKTLTYDEFKHLADHIKIAPFVQGETITRQGADAHWLYIIVTGKVEVTVSIDAGGPSRHVAELKVGDFFGEGGMMTGEKRSATVVALTDTECYRLDKESFSNIIANRKEIAEDISHVMAKRRAELDAIKEGLDEEAKQARMHEQQGDILHRILSYFESDS